MDAGVVYEPYCLCDGRTASSVPGGSSAPFRHRGACADAGAGDGAGADGVGDRD
jgi:hypothetical protein